METIKSYWRAFWMLVRYRRWILDALEERAQDMREFPLHQAANSEWIQSRCNRLIPAEVLSSYERGQSEYERWHAVHGGRMDFSA